MAAQEKFRIEAKRVFEANDIVRVKGQVHLAAAYGETLYPGMTGKGKMPLADRFHPRREDNLGIFCQSDRTPCRKTEEKKLTGTEFQSAFYSPGDKATQLSAAGGASMTSS